MRLEYGVRACGVLYNILKANEIKGKVLMPANICETVPATYTKAGIECIFCDISEKDWQIDKKQALGYIRDNNITVLHYNHTYGYICHEDDEFIKMVKKNFDNIFIVDDRCLCFPEVDKVNNDADLVLFSTGKLKCVDMGTGGIGVIADECDYDVFFMEYSEDDEVKFENHMKQCRKNNSHVDKDILLTNWLNTEELNIEYSEIRDMMRKAKEHKSKLNDVYSELPGCMQEDYCKWRYQLLLYNASECREALFQAGLFCSSHYKSLGNGFFTEKRMPVCEYLEKHIVNLFNDFYYTLDQAQKTKQILDKLANPVL